MRTCSCGTPITPETAWRVRKSEPELSSRCKECARASSRRWADRNRAKKCAHGRKMSRLRRKADKKATTPQQREARRARSREYYQSHNQEFRARGAVNEAVRRGKKWLEGSLGRHKRRGAMLFPALFCSLCGWEGGTVAHHPHYGEHRKHLVIWVCRQCHSDIHVACRQAEFDGKDPLSGLAETMRMRKEASQRRQSVKISP